MNTFQHKLDAGGKGYTYYPIAQIEGADRLPFSLRVLLENVLRNARTEDEARRMAERIVEAGTLGQVGEEVEFCPARVLFQDFTGVPVFVDFAVMREAAAQLGGDPKKINPLLRMRPDARDVLTRTQSSSLSATASAMSF